MGHHYSGSQGQLPTLPPLQSGGASFTPSLYSGHNSNPQTPVTSASNGSSSMPQPAPLRPIQPSPSAYMPMSSAYSQAPLLSTASAHSNAHQQLATSQGMGMPHPSLYPHPPTLTNQEPEPLHVVGQQGRRGVLPTHPGRPQPAAGKTPTNAVKNAEGKYECPHCNKTYLHLKHLKRHLLRRKYDVRLLIAYLLTLNRHWRATLLMPSLQRYLQPKRHLEASLSEVFDTQGQPYRCKPSAACAKPSEEQAANWCRAKLLSQPHAQHVHALL